VNTWHTLEAEEVVQQLGSHILTGLSQEQVTQLQAEHGPNQLVERGARSPWRILWEQLTAIMVLVLIAAAVISIALADYEDAAAILVIVVLNTLLGFQQEYQAEKAMVALKKLTVPLVRVRRDGQVQEVAASVLVPGDIVLLEAGNVVPADCRLLESVGLKIQEASLTGESEAVEKQFQAICTPDTPMADRLNMVYMGTIVTYGRGLAIVTSTGMNTELGSIAEMLQAVRQEQTPLQRRLNDLAKVLSGAALVIVAVVFALGLWRGQDLRLMFLTMVSLAVAAVPEGLPAVVTIALALGAQRMLKRRALIRKLPAVETLGSVTVICSDKTGTLTENRMTVTVLDVAGHRLDLSLTNGSNSLEPAPSHIVPSLSLLLADGALCNDTIVDAGMEIAQVDTPTLVGDPTETALVSAAAKAGLQKTALEQLFPRVDELPFDSDRKLMSTVHRLFATFAQIPTDLQAVLLQVEADSPGATQIVFTKGAVDQLLKVCDRVWVQNQTEPLNEDWQARIVAVNATLARQGLRVLGMAFRLLKQSAYSDPLRRWERNLIFVGMVGMIDPARPEAKEAVQRCKTAGIRPIMITGDHPLTAGNIAQELGISTEKERVLTGQELARLSVAEIEKSVGQVSVYARVTPEHKLKIVQALQNQGEVVAMTGDGVNDAPALKKADIGVAMGITGTDVSKEAADVVLLDDNFATIVASVEEGRVIYDNIRKFIRCILSGNFGEIMVMLLLPFMGPALPLVPIQILWLNLVTDGLPGLALSLEPAERTAMRRPPRSPKENIFARGMILDIIWGGIIVGCVAMGVGWLYWFNGRAEWQTMVFTTLTVTEMGVALASRSGRELLFRIGWLSNKSLLGAIALTVGLQLAIVYVPFLQGFFHTTALSLSDLLIILALTVLVFLWIELRKVVRSRKNSQKK
jgi:P-type Ca2+ transporter type 2C